LQKHPNSPSMKRRRGSFYPVPRVRGEAAWIFNNTQRVVEPAERRYADVDRVD
jgi:hypothetical protein